MVKIINPCSCGSKKKPDFDSDDMIPSWAIQCFDCKQFIHNSNWSSYGLIEKWNKLNPFKQS